MVGRREQDAVAVGHEEPAAGEGPFLAVGLALHGVEHLDGVDDALEHFGEGPFDEAFETVLKPLQRTHSVTLMPGSRSRLTVFSARRSSRRTTSEPRRVHLSAVVST